MSSISVELSTPQKEFFDSYHAFTLYCGGLGGGKTHAGAMWAAYMALTYPNVRGLITANSYSQLKKATLQGFFKILRELNIEYRYKSQDGEIWIGDTVIYLMSMEKYDLLRGIEVGWAWSDECAFYREEAFDVLIGRIRGQGPNLWKGTTTPNGFNWLYKRFVESPIKDSHVVYASTTDNAKNLGSNYINQLRDNYDERLAQQELEGRFVNLNKGRVYHSFDRNKHVRPVDDLGIFLTVGLDFNVHPLCGVFAYERYGKIYVTSELYQEDSNTFKAAEEIKNRYRYQIDKIICDETGNRRKSSAKNTDHEILRRYGFDVPKFRNPHIKDRQNNVNRLLYHGKLVIDPSCKKLIADLEQLAHDNKDELLGHITDALGYVCWSFMPMKKPKRQGSITYKG